MTALLGLLSREPSAVQCVAFRRTLYGITAAGRTGTCFSSCWHVIFPSTTPHASPSVQVPYRGPDSPEGSPLSRIILHAVRLPMCYCGTIGMGRWEGLPNMFDFHLPMMLALPFLQSSPNGLPLELPPQGPSLRIMERRSNVLPRASVAVMVS